MKYLLNINEFFSKRLEESKLSSSDVKTSSDNRYNSVRDFIANTKNETTIWNDIFKGRNRIYFDMFGVELDKKELIKNSKNIVLTIKNISDLNNVDKVDTVIYHNTETIKEIVLKVLSDLGYKYNDYDNNKCSKDDKNYTTISAILSRKNIGDVYKKIDLLNKYNQRNNKNVFNKPIILKQKDSVIDINDYMIVFSNHPVDLMTMSSNRPWEQTSCMRISGSNHHYVYSDIKNGSVVCYQTLKDDFNINTPNARILYKPFIDTDEETAVLFSPNKVYGNPKFDFYKASLEIVNNTFNEGVDGRFELHNDVYNDDQSTFISKSDNNIEEEDKINSNNFWDVYTDDDASDELFDSILNEYSWEGDDMYVILLPILKQIFVDMNQIGKKISLISYLDIINTVFIDDKNEVADFIDNYMDDLMDYFNDVDDGDDRYKYKILITCYEIIGDVFVYQHLQKFYDYIFSDLREYYSRQFNDGDNYTKLLNIGNVFNNQTIKKDYYRILDLFNSGEGSIKLDADNGEYLSIKKDNLTIDIYKSALKIESDILKVFVAIFNSDNKDWEEDYLSVDDIFKLVKYEDR